MIGGIRNRVQLMGLVCRTPKLFEYQNQSYVRLLLEVEEEDEGEQYYTSYHPVVMLESIAYEGGVIRVGDTVLVEGRLNNYIVTEGGEIKKRGTNVQATALVLLRQVSPAVQTVTNMQKKDIDDEDDVVVPDNGKVVSLFAAKADDEVDGEPPF